MPQTQLDKLVLNLIKLITPCTDLVTTITAGASAARKAALSAKTFQDNGDLELAAARVRRCEKLLLAIRDTNREFEKQLNQISQAAIFAASQPAKRPGSWNRLSDQWWLEKAIRIQELLSEVCQRRGELQDSWTLNSSHVHRSESYSAAVVDVSAAADTLNRCWKRLTEYVEEWEEIAKIVHAGIGESGSLIPS